MRAVVCEADAVPSRSGGTDAMIVEVLGDEKSAVPAPTRKRRTTMPATELSVSSVAVKSRAPQARASPHVLGRRAPTRSESAPEKGEITSIAMGKAARIAPASSVEKPRASTR